MAFQAKISRARHLWLTVLLLVLGLMFVETRKGGNEDPNFLLQANGEAEGAQVFIDGAQRGVLTASDHQDLAGAHFRDRLAPGTHVIEVRKPGFRTIRETLGMHLEGFMGVNLQTEKTNQGQASGGS